MFNKQLSIQLILYLSDLFYFYFTQKQNRVIDAKKAIKSLQSLKKLQINN